VVSAQDGQPRWLGFKYRSERTLTVEDDPGRPSARFSLASFEEGSVLLDLETGGYFALNRSAEHVCRILFEETEREAIERRVASEFRLSESAAHYAVEEVKRQLAAPLARLSFPGPFTYLALEDRYQLCFKSQPVLEIALDGASVRHLRTSPEPIPLAHILRVVAPKLLAQRGLTVLHASACLATDGLIAFCGLSGAGKTTTARAFEAAGMDLFSEDLIVLSPEWADSRPQALIGGESAAHTWARDAAYRSKDRGELEIDCRDLLNLVVGSHSTIPLARIIFVDASRRNGHAITTTPLKHSDALIQILISNFLGSVDRSSWLSYFDRAAAIVRAAEMSLAVMPDGTDKLPLAVRLYRENSAS
jgi:hypothetical protein